MSLFFNHITNKSKLDIDTNKYKLLSTILQGRVSNSALKQQHPCQLVSDVEDERVVHNELRRPERRHQHHAHPRGRGGLAALLVDLDRDLLLDEAHVQVPSPVHAGEVRNIIEHVFHA